MTGARFLRSAGAPSHYIHKLRRIFARHCTRRLRLSCGEHWVSHSVGSDSTGSSIIPVLENMFMEGLALHGIAPGVDAAMLATTAAWAVYGATRRWFQNPNRIPAW